MLFDVISPSECNIKVYFDMETNKAVYQYYALFFSKNIPFVPTIC